MKIGVITLFPEIFEALEHSITGRALKNNQLELQLWQLRDFAHDKHKTVDDKPYGGGPGMLMKVEPLAETIQFAKHQLGESSKVIYLSPQGKVFKQAMAVESAQNKQPLIFIAGRYEGIDERLLESMIDEEWSIGDYVLTGGEFAGLVIIDAITRLLPGVLGDKASAEQDSFSQSNLLDHPHYTRPEIFNGQKVPEVLLSGNHAEIAKWRHEQAVKNTKKKRPDLSSK
jgi:tRNA (guanine37-N1)-methyltransferase